MRQQVCEGTESVPDPVRCGSYTMDSHNMRRYMDEHGHVHNEGTLGLPVKKTYGISYRSLTPKEEQCTNLLVPVCISASHMVYGSMRMEPVLMVLGQSATTTAAVLALEGGTSVQQVPYEKLKINLERDGQVLAIPASSSRSKKE